MSTARGSLAAAVLDGKVYALGEGPAGFNYAFMFSFYQWFLSMVPTPVLFMYFCSMTELIGCYDWLRNVLRGTCDFPVTNKLHV